MRTRVCLCLWLVGVSAVALERPRNAGDFLYLDWGEYLYAEPHPALDEDVRDAISIDFWFRIDSEAHLPFQQRVVLYKPGAWGVIIRRGGDEVEEPGRWRDHEKTTVVPRMWMTIGQFVVGADWTLAVSRTEFPLREWNHVRIEREYVGARLLSSYVNGVFGSVLRHVNATPRLTNSETRLYIGDAPSEALGGEQHTELPYDPIAHYPILIDELRISRVMRDRPEERDLEHVPFPDADTQALWRFNEGRRSPTFRDDGTNDISLYRESLDVEPRGKTATTWAALKEGGSR